MVMFPGPQGDALQKVVDNYNDTQGLKDNVQVQTVMLSRADTFGKEATQMAAKSSDIDLYFTASYIIGQQAPNLDPLTTVDESAYFDSSIEGLTVNGKLMAQPLNVSNTFLIYRKDLIEKLLDDPAEHKRYEAISQEVLGKALQPKAPDDWSWDDYTAAAAYFTKQYNPESPTKYGTALQAKNLSFNVMIWNDLLWSNGGNWIKNGKADLTSDAAEAAVNTYRTIYTKGLTSPDSSSAEFPETQAALQNNNAAFALQWSTAFNSLNDPKASPNIAGNMAIARIPGKLHSNHAHTQGFALNKYSKNKDGALTWLKFLNSEAAMTEFAAAGGIPASPGVLEANVANNPSFPYIADQIANYGFNEPIFSGTFQALGKLAASLSGAWVGEKPVKEALKDANSELTALLDQ